MQDPVHVVKSLNDAFARRDRQAFAALLDPEIEWTSAENFLYADRSPYIGIQAVVDLIFGRLVDDWDNFSLATHEYLGGGDLVIANSRFRGVFRVNGASIDAQTVQVFQVKNGKIAKCQVYTDTAQFRDAVSHIRHVAQA